MKMEQNSLAARRKFLGDPFSLSAMPSMDLMDDNRLSAAAEKQAESYRRHPRPSALFPVHILPYLYLGNDETAKNLNVLNRSAIRYVINVTSNLPNYYEEEPGFRYLRIAVDDSCSHNLAQFFPEAISFIEKARSENASVLVHCWAGISRSVTVCLAYLMYALHSTLEEAFDLLLKQNGTIAPNFHFMETLTCWERQLFDGVDSGSTSSCASSASTSAASSAVSSASAFCSPVENAFSTDHVMAAECSSAQHEGDPTMDLCQSESDERTMVLSAPSRVKEKENCSRKASNGGKSRSDKSKSSSTDPYQVN